jgi:hypothetical protein
VAIDQEALVPSVESVLLRRLQHRRDRWPTRARVAVQKYLAPTSSRTSRSARRRADPIWLRLPAWLAARGRNSMDRTFLSDVQWGQYCLFLFVRIHDDVFDRHVTDPVFVYAADLLLIDSERAFARQFGKSAFWPFYRDSLNTTLTAILEANALERRPQGLGGADTRVHARVASIFKVGAAAVCIKAGRPADLRRVGPFLDHLAIVSQMIDDLKDLRDDAIDGRRNSIATAIADPRRGLNAVVSDMRRHLRAALAAIKPLKLPAAERHVAELLHGVEVLGLGVHRMQVRAVFSRVRNG